MAKGFEKNCKSIKLIEEQSIINISVLKYHK
jgi:hypothetical protein